MSFPDPQSAVGRQLFTTSTLSVYGQPSLATPVIGTIPARSSVGVVMEVVQTDIVWLRANAGMSDYYVPFTPDTMTLDASVLPAGGGVIAPTNPTLPPVSTETNPLPLPGLPGLPPGSSFSDWLAALLSQVKGLGLLAVAIFLSYGWARRGVSQRNTRRNPRRGTEWTGHEKYRTRRYDLYGALWLWASRYHRGQRSKEYRILSILRRIGYRPGLGLQHGRFESEEQKRMYLALVRRRPLKGYFGR